MSLPAFSTQAELFSTAGLSGCLFGPTDRYRLFALKIYPVLVQARSQLQGCYCADNGRVALEPVRRLRNLAAEVSLEEAHNSGL